MRQYIHHSDVRFISWMSRYHTSEFLTHFIINYGHISSHCHDLYVSVFLSLFLSLSLPPLAFCPFFFPVCPAAAGVISAGSPLQALPVSCHLSTPGPEGHASPRHVRTWEYERQKCFYLSSLYSLSFPSLFLPCSFFSFFLSLSPFLPLPVCVHCWN